MYIYNEHINLMKEVFKVNIFTPIDDAEKQLSLLRKNIKKRAVAHSKKGKVILKIYNAAGKCSYRYLCDVGYIWLSLFKNLELLTKEIDKALKIKDLYSENLKKINNFFKDASKKLKSYVTVLEKYVGSNITSKITIDDSSCESDCEFKNSSLKWIDSIVVNKFDEEYSKIFANTKKVM